MHEFLNFSSCIIILAPTIVILVTLKGKKPHKVKEDILFFEKQVLKFFILSFYSLFFLYELLKEDKESSEMNTIFKIKILIFNIYIVLLFMNNFFLCIEDYLTYTNPNHYFSSLFHKKKKNAKYEFISIFFACILSLLYININLDFKTILHINIKINYIKKYFDKDKYLFIDLKNKTSNVAINEMSPFIIFNLLKLIFIIILNIIIFLLYIILFFKIKKLIFKAREKLFRNFKIKIISTLMYFIFIAFNIFLLWKERHRDILNIQLIRTINSYLFLLVYFIDTLLEFVMYSTSKFAQYKLRHTIVDSIGSIFNRDKEDMSPNKYLDSMLHDSLNSKSKYTSSIDDEEENTLIMPLNSKDIELVLIYRNQIFIEDYFFYYYDYMINIILSGLFKVYKTKIFSPSVLNNNKLNRELSITESDISDEYDKKNKSITSIYSFKKTDTDKDSFLNICPNSNNFEFTLKKNSSKNDFLFPDEIFTNAIKDFSTDNITLKIHSYFTTKCVSNLLDKNLTTNMISDSLKSHINKKNSDIGANKINRNNISGDINLDMPYNSILSCNAKEEYFLNLKNISIKTYDKQLTFDIFDSNDDDISLTKNNRNKKMAKILDKYFDYIKKVGVSGTFIPIILGIFKVKINDFKTMLIFISYNSLMENSPSNNYTYWQMIRFSFNEMKKISSSKYRHHSLIGDDLIFDRKYAVSSIKQDKNSSYNKIEIKNYSNFKDILKKDISFLSHCGLKFFNLLMMYFEYQIVLKSENVGAIKIKKIENNKVEIINAFSMPIFQEEEESDSNLNRFDFSKKQDSEEATIPTIPISTIEGINHKKSNDTSNRISILNENLNIDQDKRENEIYDENNKKKENLDIDLNKSGRNKDNDLKKKISSRFQSSFGSFSNIDFIDETMQTYDENTFDVKDKNLKGGQNNNNILNYSENIAINSYDGYFDSFNCICLFSFENIFDFNSGNFCDSVNYSQYQRNILKNFFDYIPRKHTIINNSTKYKK